MKKDKLLTEWESARDDLGIEIVAPFEVTLSETVKVRVAFLVKNFGGEKGTVVVKDFSLIRPYQALLSDSGYGWSVLEEPSQENAYDREVFVDMLSEWEWTGDSDKKPKWIREVGEPEP